MELRTYGTRNVFAALGDEYHEALVATALTPMQAEQFAAEVNKAIKGTDFDPIDLALLGAGWQSADVPLTIEAGSYLHDVARMLHRVYTELCEPDGYPGVFGYEISEPLGKWLAENEEPELREAEATVREWITTELERTA